VHQVVSDHPVLLPADLGYNICYGPDGRYMRLLPTMTNTPNLQWFVNEFCGAERAAAEASGANLWDELERLAGTVPLGSEGVMYHPYIDPAGERAPFVSPAARAQFTGLSMGHTRPVLLRALYEGVALSVIDCYRTMEVPLHELRVAGGGARSPLWSQILSDALGCPVIVAEGQEYGAKGAVINAGVAVGVYRSYEDAIARTVRTAQRFTPVAERTAAYAVLLEVYRSIRDAMIPVWETRARLLGGI
jgi:sugar (pentulose or hexulose) kinase